MSRSAVSCEHFASFAHFEEVSLPSKPFNNRLIMLRWPSLNSVPANRSQKRALLSTAARMVSARSKARPRHARNHPRRLAGVSVFREAAHDFAVGDRIQFTAQEKSSSALPTGISL